MPKKRMSRRSIKANSYMATFGPGQPLIQLRSWFRVGMLVAEVGGMLGTSLPIFAHG